MRWRRAVGRAAKNWRAATALWPGQTLQEGGDHPQLVGAIRHGDLAEDRTVALAARLGSRRRVNPRCRRRADPTSRFHRPAPAGNWHRSADRPPSPGAATAPARPWRPPELGCCLTPNSAEPPPFWYAILAPLSAGLRASPARGMGRRCGRSDHHQGGLATAPARSRGGRAAQSAAILRPLKRLTTNARSLHHDRLPGGQWSGHRTPHQ